MSSNTHTMDRVMLTMPSLLTPGTLSNDAVPSSWIQLAKVGSFVSNRYGKFEISRADLAQMVHNFHTVTPKSPTQLPVDWDHLSMSPSKPGDGAAAGWMSDVELRDNGDTIWARVEWTPVAAAQIKNREYRFVSPSFTKNYIDTTTGKPVGTTLLAAAITNHPFLSGMRGLSLFNVEIMGDVAMNAAGVPQREAAVQYSLAKIGDRVSFIDDDTKVPELTPKERADTYVIRSVQDIPGRDDQLVRVDTLAGKEFGYFVTSQLAPAPAPDKAQHPPAPMEPVQPAPKMDTPLPGSPPTRDAGVPDPVQASADPDADLVVLSQSLAKEHHISLSEATKRAGDQRRDLVLLRDGHRPHALPSGNAPAAPLSLSASQRAATNFTDFVLQLEQDRHLKTREAMSLAESLRPDLARQYAEQME